MSERDTGWDFHLRTLSISARDSNTANDPASDPSLLHSVQFSLSLSLMISMNMIFYLSLLLLFWLGEEASWIMQNREQWGFSS